ncbi:MULTISPECIES: phosphonate ABC transporter ATP-binding protein [Nisaea]|uniref:phosphonate ABC transporter ATP-binding protein n=1 Tax=Nisaea TaxID=390876 RepID=UPI000423F1B0|nr:MULTISPECIES: phosphonate ABC transporter ATP-binding protein [Nisaea]
MIEFKNVTKAFGNMVAVDSVTFTVDKPQMIGVIGRSGAGKSTFLRLFNRLTSATSGQILVEGTDVLSLKGNAKRRWQKDCAMIFQQFNLVPRLDVVTNVMLGRLNQQGTLRSMFKIFSQQDIDDALAALDRLGLAERALQRVETMSGGQQQRVAIARGLMQAPKIILADEPIASLDPLSAEVVMGSLREIHDRDGITVMCNLHTLDTARSYCDRVIGMSQGKVVFDGTADELTPEAAREIYGADEALNEAVTSTSISAGASARAKSDPSVPGHGATVAEANAATA